MSQAYAVGDRIKFKGERQAYTIRACSDRFLVCTKPFNLQRTVIYSIVDLEKQIRGTDTSRCHTYETDEDCLDSLVMLTSGRSSVSRRNWVELEIEKVSGPKRSALTPGAPT